MMMRSRKPTEREPWFTIQTVIHQHLMMKRKTMKLNSKRYVFVTQTKAENIFLILTYFQVGEAYAILSDEKKRRMYDSGQDLEDGGCGGGFHDVDPNSIFQAFFGGGGMGGMGGMGGHHGMGGHSFQFSGNPGQSFSFQFG